MDRDPVTKEYTNGEVTVVWKPDLCIHSTNCWRELPSVFQPSQRPWVKMEGAPTDRIVAQVRRCPSGALSYYYNDGVPREVPGTGTAKVARVEVMPNGPLLVHGPLVVRDAAGRESKKARITAFCRCGHSANKPFCDGSHTRHRFEE